MAWKENCNDKQNHNNTMLVLECTKILIAYVTNIRIDTDFSIIYIISQSALLDFLI